jgi:catecholate siderophore receptor
MRIKFKSRRAKTLTRRTKELADKRERTPGRRFWVAAGALAAYAAGSGQTAQAQTAVQTPVAQHDETAQTLSVIRFDIPAGTLETVIAAYEQATGRQVVIGKEGIRSLRSPGVTGIFTADQALRQLLAGTGVISRTTGAQTLELVLAAVRETVNVSERPSTVSPRYTEPLRDLPQTISVIPRTVIEQQGATTLSDVLRNVPGMTLTAGEGGTPAGDNLTLRGFSARNDIFVDGVRDLSPQARDPFNMEQVEVTKGPTSAVSGRGSAGGTINLISKGPGLSHILSGSVALGNADTRRITADVNTPFRPLGEHTGLRLNMLWHESGVAGRDVVKNDRWGMAPTLAFGLGTPTRLTLGYYKLRQNNISDYGIPWVPVTNNALVEYRDQPAPVPRNTFYGFADRDHERLNQDTATVKVEHDFSDKSSIRNQLRYGRSGRDSLASPPRFAGNDSTAINREMRSWIAKDRIWDNQTDFRLDFGTRGIQHRMVAGVSLTNENNIRINRTAPNSPTTLFNPNPADVYTGAITTSPFIGDLTGKTQALFLFDTAKFGRHWEATGGLRWERFRVDGVSTVPAPVTQLAKMTSGRAGLIYKPADQGSIYASYGTSLSPSLEGLSYNTANTNIPPEKTYTVETGVKWDFLRERLLLTGALFRVAKDNARTPGILPTDPPQVLDGTQESKGVELSASGAITRSLRVMGGYTFMNGKIIRSNNPAEVGKFFINTPQNSATAWITYAARKFTFGVGPRYMGSRYGNNINTRRVDGYWTVDGMASYNVNRHLDLRLNLTNMNDAFYFDRLGGGHLIPGPARTLLVSSNFRF